MDWQIITLDGPAGSGKSSVARQLATRLGLEFLDTGAMYRGLAQACLHAGFDLATDDPEARQRVTELAATIEMNFDWSTDPPALHVNGRDVTHRLRDADVTALVSDIAAMGEVRNHLVAAQQRIGREHPRLVTEGRDQGSVVFPNATLKFYLDATPQVRARRRAQQMRDAGQPADEGDILAGILDRDRKDSTRKDGPLICPADALRIDTSDITLDAVVDLLETHSRDKLGKTMETCQPVAD